LVQWRAIAKDGADLPPTQVVMRDASQFTFAGEIYDFEYQPQEPGILRVEVASGALQMKVMQQIEVLR
jgi:hypothetical protein